MKNKLLLILGVIALTALSFQTFTAAKPEYAKPEEPWRPDQLLAPADLAKTIGDAATKQPLIISIGPGAIIKGSIDIGPGRDTANIAKLRQRLSELPKDANIVIYCGCCPFVRCPNIRPAFALLNEMKFTQPRLLNIEHNIKTDWIDKGYPTTN